MWGECPRVPGQSDQAPQTGAIGGPRVPSEVATAGKSWWAGWRPEERSPPAVRPGARVCVLLTKSQAPLNKGRAVRVITRHTGSGWNLAARGGHSPLIKMGLSASLSAA